MFFLNSILFLFHVCNICSSLKILTRFLFLSFFEVYFSLPKLSFSKLLSSLFGSILFSRGFLGCLLICGCLLILKRKKWKKMNRSSEYTGKVCQLWASLEGDLAQSFSLGNSRPFLLGQIPQRKLSHFLPERKRFDCQCSKSQVEGDGWEP